MLGALGERDALVQLNRCRAHALRFGLRSRHGTAVSRRLGSAQQYFPRHNDAAVGLALMLFRPVLDRPHAFLSRCILHCYAIDTSRRMTVTLRLAIKKIVVRLV